MTSERFIDSFVPEVYVTLLYDAAIPTIPYYDSLIENYSNASNESFWRQFQSMFALSFYLLNPSDTSFKTIASAIIDSAIISNENATATAHSMREAIFLTSSKPALKIDLSDHSNTPHSTTAISRSKATTYFVSTNYCCILLTRGNVDADAGDFIDISDLVFLVAYMFQEGTEPFCFEEANIDGTGVIDIGMLSTNVSSTEMRRYVSCGIVSSGI